MEGQALFEKIVALSGVSTVLAPGLVRRALLDGKVRVEHATVADYRAALPRILARMRAYMPEDEAQRRARRIGALLAQLETGRSGGEEASDDSLLVRVEGALRSGAGAEGAIRSPSAEPVSPEDFGEDVTLVGRRYTAHERELLRQAGVSTPLGEGGRGSGDDER